MTAPAPSPGSLLPEESPQGGGAVDKPGPSRKAIITWTIIMTVVVAMAVVGGLVYRPLRLWYAIREVRTAGPQCAEEKWLRLCVDAARRGDQRAMLALGQAC